MNRYNPYDHAEQLGITVIHRPLRTAHGFWIPSHNAIVIRSGLRAVHDRSALAHELGHASLGHLIDGPKQETQADRFAARNLIDAGRCAEALRVHQDEHRAALELGVTTRLLRVFLDLYPMVG